MEIRFSVLAIRAFDLYAISLALDFHSFDHKLAPQ